MKKKWQKDEPQVAEPIPVTPAGERSPHEAYFPAAERYVKGESSWIEFKADVKAIAGPTTGRDLLDLILADYRARH